MKIINILGGLGNQMFEYAMYVAVQSSHPEEEVRCCTRSFKGYGLHNGFELQRVFGIEVKEATLGQLMKLAYPFVNYRTWQIMRHWLPVRKKTMTRGALNIPFDYREVLRDESLYYDGYWQNEGFFLKQREKLLTLYSFLPFTDELNLRLWEQMKNEITVSCHIRRGDYLKEPGMCVCTPDYYVRAIRMVNDRVHPTMYCIFSDDIPWCQEHMNDLGLMGHKVVFIGWNTGENSYRDMQLMSLCDHNIIANSSFSWWGAWLGKKDGRVIAAPEKWAHGNVVNDPICDDWIRVKI